MTSDLPPCATPFFLPTLAYLWNLGQGILWRKGIRTRRPEWREKKLERQEQNQLRISETSDSYRGFSKISLPDHLGTISRWARSSRISSRVSNSRFTKGTRRASTFRLAGRGW